MILTATNLKFTTFSNDEYNSNNNTNHPVEGGTCPALYSFMGDKRFSRQNTLLSNDVF